MRQGREREVEVPRLPQRSDEIGLLARAAPEMNVFLLGLPLKVFISISMVALALPMLPGAVSNVTNQAVRHGLGTGG